MCGFKHANPGMAFILELGCADAVPACVVREPNQ